MLKVRHVGIMNITLEICYGVFNDTYIGWDP